MYSERTFALGLLFLCLITPLATAQVYTVTDLGPITPSDINTWGQVAGNYNGRAAIWTRSHGTQDLGLLSGGTFSSAAAINDLGTVAGVADGAGIVVSQTPGYPSKDCSNLHQPFVWTRTHGMQGLGATMFFDEQYSIWCDLFYFATDINIHDQVVGRTDEFHSYLWGFDWANPTGMTLIADDYQTAANGINNVGQVVGQTGFLEQGPASHAALWDNGLKTDLGTLGGNWSYSSGANGINDLSQVVGWSSAVPCCFPYTVVAVRAFLWKAGAGMHNLGTLPGDTSSVARRINVFGQVIGSSGNKVIVNLRDPAGSIEVIGRPFIWSKGKGMRDLNTLISARSGWVLNSATGINVWGQIVGSGTRNGKPRGFLLTPRTLFQF